MELNKTHLKIMYLIAQRNELNRNDLAKSIKICKSLQFRYIKQLIERGFIDKQRNFLTISSNQFSRILSNILIKDPSLIDNFSDLGIQLLISIVINEPLTLKEIANDLNTSIPTTYRYIKGFLNRQILYKEGQNIHFNKQVWPDLYQFIELYKSYILLVQFKSVPNNAKIYFESPHEILFSLPIETKVGNFKQTAFSIYRDYGINLLENEFFYRADDSLKKRINIKSILLDSLRIAGTKHEESIRRKIYCFIFYLKNINNLRRVTHKDLDILKKIAKGEVIDRNKYKDFPTQEELIDKCESYGIGYKNR
ncbi:MAG: MarR family transcriptional regulator [Candidatus Nanoarchaeia archaeon]|jgi:predicted transcriptional regulator